MKKLLLSLLTVVTVVGAMAMGTKAYFSDTETSTGNTFTTGTIDIAVDDENPWTTQGTFTIEDMKPSTVFYRTVTVQNVGNNVVDLWKKVTVTGYSGGAHPESEYSEDQDDTDNQIGGVIRYDMTLDDEEIMSESDDYVLDGGNHQLDGTVPVNGLYMYLGRLDPDSSMTVKQSYHMDSSTTNWAQGDVANVEVEFYAQQTSGGAPAPGDELAGYSRDNLDYLDVGDSDSADMLVHDAQGWMDDPDPNGGSYGNHDGGETIAMTWGEGGNCSEDNRSATFMMNSGSVAATSLDIRHLDGLGDDSFDVYVNGIKVGSYTDQTSSETWYTTNFTVSFTGSALVEIVPTADASSGCGQWGQLALNWVELK